MTQSAMQTGMDLGGSDKEFGALFSPCKRYRWRLWRTWDRSKPPVLWVMLNPSVAGALDDDATIRRCIGFAKRWGYGGIVVINLFAFISTDAKALLEASDPVGRPDNIDTFYAEVDGAKGPIIAAWGNQVPKGHDVHAQACRSVLRGRGAQCLGHTLSGQPKHPLRLNYDTRLRPL